MFDCYSNTAGECPIIHSTSDTHDFDVDTPFTSMTVAFPYENIADVQVKAIGLDKAAARYYS